MIDNHIDDKKSLSVRKNRGEKPQWKLFFLMSNAIFLSGCVAAYIPPPLPTTHPANPAAPEAPLPPLSQVFSSENVLPVPPTGAVLHSPHTGHHTMHGGDR